MEKTIIINKVDEDIHNRLKVNSAIKKVTMRDYVLQAILMKFYLDENPEKMPENFPENFAQLAEPKFKTVKEVNESKWKY
jgi:hypothetical protein